MENKDCYVYYSYEQWGRGYIGYRKCPKGETPETDTKYLGSYKDKSFKPTEKIILFQNLTIEEAQEIEAKLHAFYNVKDNPHFANKVNASEGFNGDNNSGKRWYTDGKRNKLCFPREEPKGWWKGKTLSEETKQKMSGENNPFFGRKHSEESKQKCVNHYLKNISRKSLKLI